VKENISGITWTVYGKISTIAKTDGTAVSYTYDVAGNRISKAVTAAGATTTTWYVRDASGNVMSIYTAGDNTVNSGHLTQTEIPIYGSSRLGEMKPGTDVQTNINITASATTTNNLPVYLTTFTRGQKIFELSNHLGNVLVTITDKKIGVDANGDGLIESYTADVVTAQDYYPPGMLEPGRQFNATTGYRYGFNGQENSDEVGPSTTTAEYWEYDARIGRRWNIDPKPSLDISPYSVFFDNPILHKDILGDTPTVYEAAQMAADAYNTFSKRQKISGGWKRLQGYGDVSFENSDGYRGALYSRTINGKPTEYTFATAGTDPTTISDIVADATQPLGVAEQYDFARTQAIALNNVLKSNNQELTFVGHSLGGGEASLNALTTDRPAITFNAAGVSLLTKYRYGLLLHDNSSISAFVIPGEAIDYFQGIVSSSAEGNHIYVHPDYGQMNSTFAFIVKHQQQSLTDRFKLHLMDAMGHALGAAGYLPAPYPMVPISQKKLPSDADNTINRQYIKTFTPPAKQREYFKF
jgi:YD repeat-containing protein